MKKRYAAAVSGIWVLVCMLSGCTSGKPAVVYDTGDGSEAAVSEVIRDESTEEAPQTLFVHVCGEVNAPGVYELPAGSRVCQAIEAAGGLTGEADDRLLNQAALLADGMQIRVCAEAETGPADGTGMLTDDSGMINLNTADRDALMALPGIGEARAAAIIEYRELHGGFSRAEELLNIEGIGEKSFSRLKKLVTV